MATSSPSAVAEFMSDRKDDYGTLGIHIAMNSGDKLLSAKQIQHLVPGSWAYACGQVERGDEIVAVDGVPVDEQNIVSQVKGSSEIGSKCELTLRRGTEVRRVGMIRGSAARLKDFSEVFRLVHEQEEHLRQQRDTTSLIGAQQLIQDLLVSMEAANVKAEGSLHAKLSASAIARGGRGRGGERGREEQEVERLREQVAFLEQMVEDVRERERERERDREREKERERERESESERDARESERQARDGERGRGSERERTPPPLQLPNGTPPQPPADFSPSSFPPSLSPSSTDHHFPSLSPNTTPARSPPPDNPSPRDSPNERLLRKQLEEAIAAKAAAQDKALEATADVISLSVELSALKKQAAGRAEMGERVRDATSLLRELAAAPGYKDESAPEFLALNQAVSALGSRLGLSYA